MPDRLKAILEKIKEGNNIALISDAGTPIISDPGEVIVKEAIKENIEVYQYQVLVQRLQH